jgi:hypothetical protein
VRDNQQSIQSITIIIAINRLIIGRIYDADFLRPIVTLLDNIIRGPIVIIDIRAMIKDLEKRNDKAMKRSDTDDLWIKIESLQWVLFVIFAIKNERMIMI